MSNSGVSTLSPGFGVVGAKTCDVRSLARTKTLFSPLVGLIAVINSSLPSLSRDSSA
eukprot:TRINITY_DN8905_c0_g1_i1.p2 TRINITY_DN8905_c0_g1~~TRINITY_DN8905_c0_g1_i1.p2  ORF type:complete len:57 (+),score=13.04 TRINITY_DN8905_c0_g1_i1:99-269(+)